MDDFVMPCAECGEPLELGHDCLARPAADFVSVHAYGGRELDQPSPVDGCLLCRLEASESHGDEMRQLAHRLEEENIDLREDLKRARACLAGLYEEVGQLVNSVTGSGEEGFSRVPNERIWQVIGASEAVRDYRDAPE